MSELDRMISRMVTQRACLEHAAQLIADVTGDVLEVGLGKARTFDHLRGLFPSRTIYAFDREVHCPPMLAPSDDHLFLGDFRDSLGTANSRLGRSAAFIHADIGSKNLERDAQLAADVGPLIGKLAVAGAVVLTDRSMDAQGWAAVALPDGVSGDWPYFMYRIG